MSFWFASYLQSINLCRFINIAIVCSLSHLCVLKHSFVYKHQVLKHVHATSYNMVLG